MRHVTSISKGISVVPHQLTVPLTCRLLYHIILQRNHYETSNGNVIDLTKDKMEFVGTYQKISKVVDITINVGNTPLKQVSENKYLGMWIDNKNVNWKYHLDKVFSKLSRRRKIQST